MVLAARAAGKERPVDGRYLKLDDDEGCERVILPEA